jgi:NDP-sugar pyrophosphorylase family protein
MGVQDVIDGLGGIHDFLDGLGPVEAQRYINPDGSVGGWVARSVKIYDTSTVWVSYGASVGAFVTLFGGVEILGEAFVGCRAHMRNSVVKDQARVEGDCVIGIRADGGARPVISEFAVVTGNASVTGDSLVNGHAYVGGVGPSVNDSTVTDNARVFGGYLFRCVVEGNATIHGNPTLSNGVRVCGNASVGGNARVDGKVVVDGDAFLSGDSSFSEQTTGGLINSNSRGVGAGGAGGVQDVLGVNLLYGK